MALCRPAAAVLRPPRGEAGGPEPRRTTRSLIIGLALISVGCAGPPKISQPINPPSLTVQWTDTSGGTARTRVERREQSSPTFTVVDVLPPGFTGLVDRTIRPGVTYCYRAQAVEFGTLSPYTAEVCGVGR